MGWDCRMTYSKRFTIKMLSACFRKLISRCFRIENQLAVDGWRLTVGGWRLVVFVLMIMFCDQVLPVFHTSSLPHLLVGPIIKGQQCRNVFRPGPVSRYF